MSDGGKDGSDRSSPIQFAGKALASGWTRLAAGAKGLKDRFLAWDHRKPVVLVALVAVIAGFGGGYLFGQSGGGGRLESSGGAGGAEATAPRGIHWPLFGRPRAAGARRADRVKPEGFAVWRHRVDASGSDPKACIEMSKPLNPRASYADFVLLSPDPGGTPAVSVNGSELCVGGLGFADRRVTLVKGLPGQGSDKLAENADVDFVFGEMPPYVGFAGDGVILPREEADGVGIETVNVTKLAVEVWRVSDRNLVRQEIATSEPVSQGGYMGSWGDDYPNDEGEKVWSGDVAVTGPTGERVTTVFPLGAVLREMKAGGYIVTARDASRADKRGRDRDDEDYDYGSSETAAARRWVIFTDMALMSYTGSEGLDVVVRSLATARAMPAVRVALVAANGQTLAEANSDANGAVHFADSLTKGRQGMAARMLMAYGPQEDLAVLDLNRAPVDLSRQGVGGRTDEGGLTDGRTMTAPIDSYVYADRGIYRPGETAHVTALIRDRGAKAVGDRRGALVIYRPSGVEFGRYRFNDAAGGYVAKDVGIPRSAPRGRWRAAVELEGIEQPVGEVSFTVEDFAPQRLAVDSEAQADQPVKAGEVRSVNVIARFLYGAPGAGLATQGEARLSEDANPFPQFAAYRFGNDREPFEQQALDITSTVTDGAGRAVFSVPASAAGDTATPLRAVITASVFEPGGRPVRESVFLKVRPKPVYLGVKVVPGDARGRDAPVDFDIIALNPEGRRILANGVQWTLIKENWDYNWFQQNGRWQWQRTSRDVVAAQGQGAITAAKGLAFRKNLNWGDYRIEVTGPDGAETVVTFAAGWGAPADDGDAPDLVRVTAGDKKYGQGDTIDLAIKAPYAGEAQIAVATDHVIEIRTVSIGANGGVVHLRTNPQWGGGAYVMVSVVQPRDPSRAPTPRRAMGVAYVPLDPGSRKLGVEIGTPAKMHSRDEIKVPVRVSGAGIGRARVTVAAVDEGILRLTGFDSPDPAAWYFGKRALGVDYRDDYARLLDPNLGAPAGVNFGGDEIGGEGLTVTPIRTVALWSGVVETGLDGRATVTLPAAEFNGELRLMAVAWTADAVGSGAKTMTVREPVIADLNLPRFLSPGDRATATLELHNLEGKAGPYDARLTGSGGLGATFRRLVQLASGQRTTERVEVGAPARAGIGSVEMNVSGPSFTTTKTYPIQTRLGWGPQVRTYIDQQAAGAAFTPPASMLEGFLPGSMTMHVSYSPFRGFDPAAVALALHGYQYGCTEQIVSTAYPLLYSDRVQTGGKAPESSLRGLDNAVQQLLGRQSVDGAFGLWTVGDGAAEPWLGAYATDFLIEAKARGATVPQDAIDRALSAMRQVSQPDGWAPVSYKLRYPTYWFDDQRMLEQINARMRSRSSAYALYVMAKGGKGDLARLRWWHDVQMKNDPSPLARAQVGAGLAMMGDKARAKSALNAAISALNYREEHDWYQSPLRDLSGVIVYAYEAGEPALARSLQGRLENVVRAPDQLNTQEQARLLQAAYAMLADSGTPNITATGAIDLPKTAGQPRWAVGLVTDARFVNAGRGPLWRTVTVRGTPLTSPPASSNGAGVTKSLYTFTGGQAAPGAITQGDRIIVRITGVSAQARTAQMVIDDALPAGWEIETLLSPDDAQNGPFKFLGKLSYVSVQEKRDDRYVASLDVAGRQAFTVAYIARAVTPGNYYLPGVEVKDMYRPQVNARSAGSRTVIAARP